MTNFLTPPPHTHTHTQPQAQKRTIDLLFKNNRIRKYVKIFKTPLPCGRHKCMVWSLKSAFSILKLATNQMIFCTLR